jgi:hypothetical protein
MTWLAVDGYGFDLAYFDTARYVTGQRRPPPYPWEGWSDYFLRAVDQGIGRALWFVHGGQVANVISAVDGFATARQADLWSGIGLAATFAGGFSAASLAVLREAAGDYRADLAQGAVFAAKARSHAGFVPGHTQMAVAALADLSVEAADALADDVELAALVSKAAPAYELWRRRVREQIAARRAMPTD